MAKNGFTVNVFNMKIYLNKKYDKRKTETRQQLSGKTEVASKHT